MRRLISGDINIWICAKCDGLNFDCHLYQRE
jgi:hypothetical protein